MGGSDCKYCDVGCLGKNFGITLMETLGWIESAMMLNAINADGERKQKIINRIAMNGFDKPEDLGNAAVFSITRCKIYYRSAFAC